MGDSSEGSSKTESKSEGKKGSLKVDTTVGDGDATVGATAATKTPTAGGSGQDIHPYARGSVIEVWHIPKKYAEDDDWWSDDSSSASEDEDATKTVRLCDVIDRVQKGNKWKYYVHYRDFNRRMDEWIGISRIVSPPSIGNAKARALKKQTEKDRKRKQAKLQALADTTTGPRNRRRTPTALEAELQAGGRRTRMSRRKSQANFLEDDATVMASNEQDGDEAYDPSTTATQKEPDPTPTVTEVMVTDAAVTTHTVGEHTVATVQAVELDEHEGLDEASLREHEEVTKIKNVGFLELGQYQMETWYYSPLPKELVNGGNATSNINSSQGFLEVLYVCEFSFRMFARKCELLRHQKAIATQDRHPPGNEIYRDGRLAMFEVDGYEEKIYCQNLCYIAKLFLDHKTLYYDVDPFLFYVLCEVDDRGYHPVGYYSKEKYSDAGFNLACILSFPAHQRKGYGRFLIAFSYELTKKEEKVGSPEKPMSDLGQQAYKPYWASTVIDFLLHQSDESALSIMDISKRTSIMAEDIVYTLNQLGILKIISGVYFIAAEKNLLTKLAKKYPVKEPRVDPSKLHWTPFLTDVRRDKFSIYSKKPSLETDGNVVKTT